MFYGRICLCTTFTHYNCKTVSEYVKNFTVFTVTGLRSVTALCNFCVSGTKDVCLYCLDPILTLYGNWLDVTMDGEFCGNLQENPEFHSDRSL